MSQVQVIVPTVEELKIEENGCMCTVQDCGGVFQTSAQLRMHVTKHHEGKKLSVRNGATHYYCPVENCERSLSKQKPFPRLGQLKQVCGWEVHLSLATPSLSVGVASETNLWMCLYPDQGTTKPFPSPS
jgi:hypothetical protein